MQNDRMNTRGYVPPQNTGSMAPLPYQTAQYQPVNGWERFKAICAQIDPSAVALLIALVLGFAYAVYATVSFWWLNQIILHFIVIWTTVVINAVATFTGRKDFMLFAAIGYGLALLLFLNFFYLMLPQMVLCLLAWFNAES